MKVKRIKLLIGMVIFFIFTFQEINIGDVIEKKYNEINLLKKEIKMIVISDTHFFPYEFTSEYDNYNEYIPNDRKLLRMSESINNEMARLVKKSDADIVLVAGDLTKDGERESHERFAKLLKNIEKSGKKVYVVPGNHDIYNTNSIKYERGNTIKVENISPDDFKKIYYEFGYKESISNDVNSLSYVVEPFDGIKIIAVDTCKYGINKNGKEFSYVGGNIDDEKLNWIKRQIEEFDVNNKLILGFMHHNLMEHFNYQDKYFENYSIDNSKIIKRDFANIGIRAVFTGHFHISDIVKNITNKGNFVYDIETGSIITFPCPYRVVSIKKDKMVLKTKRIDYLDDNGTIKHDFQKYAYEFLLEGLENLNYKILKDYIEKKNMKEYDVEYLMQRNLNNDYTVEEFFIESVMQNYCGDESVNKKQEEAVRILKNSDIRFYRLIGEIINSLISDKLPADNDCTVYFNKIN